MEKNIKLLFGALIVLVVVAIFFNGEITGKAVICSEMPEIVKIEPIGDTISFSWTETSTLKGKQLKYEISLYKQKEDGTYDFTTSDERDIVPDTFASFNQLDETKYVVKVRAKNPWGCSDYSGYATSVEIFVDRSTSGRGMP